MVTAGSALLLATLLLSTPVLAQTVAAGTEGKKADTGTPAPPTKQREHDLPLSVDLRPNFTRWGLTTRAQGSRGTCSVFTVVGAMEYAFARRRCPDVLLSVEFLNWASHTVAKRTADGGFFSELWNGYEKFGLCPEAEMPYQDRFDVDRKPSAAALEGAKTTPPPGLTLHWIKEWNPKTGLTDAQMVEIQRTLASERPVCGGFRWPKQAQWEQDVLQMCPPEAVFDGHRVLLVGYREDAAQPGGGVFLIRNSGGESRDGLLSYAYVRAYMNDAAWID